MAITPGGRPGDASPLAKPGYHGKRRLDDYVRMVAHALIRKRGMPKGRAIATAKNAIRRWSRGGGHVRPQVRAGALTSRANQAAIDAGASLSADTARDLVFTNGDLDWSQEVTLTEADFEAILRLAQLDSDLQLARPGTIQSGPGRGKYPVTTQQEVKSALMLRNHGKGVSASKVVAHVKAEARKRGLKIPKRFQKITG